ncbi:coniferyl-alcohol dehydrogenase (plasmid) [Rhizobium ruizarguesonis]|nr:coniferyl-alcohol dehydrogenase [Rhizobium ruizarguesonis]
MHPDSVAKGDVHAFGKTILVTGVASGIGARTAELAGHMGAEVIGVDVREPLGGSVAFIKGDLSTASGVADIVAQLPARLDALANVAGLSGNTGVVSTLAVNFYGLRALSEAVAPRLREGGAIVNVASIAGYGWRANLERAKSLAGIEGFPEVAAVVAEHGLKEDEGYPLSKELLLLWTMRAAHQPLFKNRGIRMNAVSPGPVETPILKQFRAVLGDAKVDSDITRVGRAGTSADIAPAVLFLCSDGGRWINGANLAVDGGLEASINAEVIGF